MAAFLSYAKRPQLPSAPAPSRVPAIGDPDLQRDVKSRRALGIAALAVILSAAIFVIDWQTEQGVAMGAAYVIVVWMANFTQRSEAIWIAALVCSSLTIFGCIISPDGAETWQVLSNRGLSLMAIWLTAFVIFIFERERAERARGVIERQRMEQRFQATVESAPTAMVMIDRAGQIVLVNAETEALFGYTRDELLGQPVEILLPERLRSKHPQHRAGFFGKPAARRMGGGRDLSARRKDGGEFPVEIGLNPVMTEAGLFVLSAIADITERKRMEVAQRELSQALNMSNKALTQSNMELEQFAYVASHDLKAPLRGIDNLVSWIVEDPDSRLSEESQQNACRLRTRVNRLEALLDGLLEYSRAGRLRADVETVDTRRLCEQITEYLAPSESFKIFIAPDLPVFDTAKPAFETVLRNLICNAVKHHDREVGRIVVSAQDRGDAYQFTVRDDGPGIDPAYHERIFEIFRTLTPREDMDNSGIGLSIVKRLVEAAGGSVHADSREDERGTAIHFTWKKLWPVEGDQGAAPDSQYLARG